MAQQKIVSIRKYAEKNKIGDLLIPYSKSDRDAIIIFIRKLECETERSSCYGRYYYMGDEFNAKMKDRESPQKEEQKNLRVALYCYQIAKSAYIGSILGSGLIEAKIRV